MYMLHLNSNIIHMYYDKNYHNKTKLTITQYMCVCLILKENWYTCKCTCTGCSTYVYSKGTCTYKN